MRAVLRPRDAHDTSLVSAEYRPGRRASSLGVGEVRVRVRVGSRRRVARRPELDLVEDGAAGDREVGHGGAAEGEGIEHGSHRALHAAETARGERVVAAEGPLLDGVVGETDGDGGKGMGGVGAERARVVRPVTERGRVAATRMSRAGAGTSGPATIATRATRRSPQTSTARGGWGSAPEREPPTVATVASNSGAGTMPCTRAAPNTVAESAGVSPPPPRGSYHCRLAPVPARSVSRAARVLSESPSEGGGGREGSAHRAVTSPTYAPLARRREEDDMSDASAIRRSVHARARATPRCV